MRERGERRGERAETRAKMRVCMRKYGYREARRFHTISVFFLFLIHERVRGPRPERRCARGRTESTPSRALSYRARPLVDRARLQFLVAPKFVRPTASACIHACRRARGAPSLGRPLKRLPARLHVRLPLSSSMPACLPAYSVCPSVSESIRVGFELIRI